MLRNIFISLCAGIIGSIIFMAIYNARYEKKLGKVDIKSIMTRHLSNYPKSQMDEKIAKQDGIKFAQSLEKSLKELAEQKGIILFISGAVVGGVQDYTKEVETMILNEMEGK